MLDFLAAASGAAAQPSWWGWAPIVGMILIFWFLFSLPRYERFSYDFLLKLYIANIFFYIPYRTKFARRRPVLRDARMDIHFGTYFIKLPYFQNSIPINTMDFHNTYCYYNHQF